MGQSLLACAPALEIPCSNDSRKSSIEDATLLKRIISSYHLIDIMQHPQYGNMLVVDNDLQIAESDHIYGQTMVAPLKTMPDIQRVLIMGGGDGGILQELLKTADCFGWPLQEVCMIESDEEVIQASRQYLPKLNAGAFNDRRTKLLIGDVFAHIKNCSNLGAVIYSLSMAPQRDGQSQSAFIEETLADISSALKPGGILSMQCCSEGGTDPFNVTAVTNDGLLEEIRFHVDRLFTDRHEQQVAVPSYQEEWTFLRARKPAATF